MKIAYEIENCTACPYYNLSTVYWLGKLTIQTNCDKETDRFGKHFYADIPTNVRPCPIEVK